MTKKSFSDTFLPKLIFPHATDRNQGRPCPTFDPQKSNFHRCIDTPYVASTRTGNHFLFSAALEPVPTVLSNKYAHVCVHTVIHTHIYKSYTQRHIRPCKYDIRCRDNLTRNEKIGINWKMYTANHNFSSSMPANTRAQTTAGWLDVCAHLHSRAYLGIRWRFKAFHTECISSRTFRPTPPHLTAHTPHPPTAHAGGNLGVDPSALLVKWTPPVCGAEDSTRRSASGTGEFWCNFRGTECCCLG